MAKKDNGLGYVKSLAAMFSPEVKQRVAEREAKRASRWLFWLGGVCLLISGIYFINLP